MRANARELLRRYGRLGLRVGGVNHFFFNDLQAVWDALSALGHSPTTRQTLFSKIQIKSSAGTKSQRDDSRNSQRAVSKNPMCRGMVKESGCVTRG